MNFNLDIDTKQLEADTLVAMKKMAEEKMKRAVFEFFSNHLQRDLDTGKLVQVKGPGMKEIDDWTTNKFCDDKFRKDMDAYFENHWETIFHAAMLKALQYKANGIAFNKVHNLIPSNNLDDVKMFTFFLKEGRTIVEIGKTVEQAATRAWRSRPDITDFLMAMDFYLEGCSANAYNFDTSRWYPSLPIVPEKKFMTINKETK